MPYSFMDAVTGFRRPLAFGCAQAACAAGSADAGATSVGFNETAEAREVREFSDGQRRVGEWNGRYAIAGGHCWQRVNGSVPGTETRRHRERSRCRGITRAARSIRCKTEGNSRDQSDHDGGWRSRRKSIAEQIRSSRKIIETVRCHEAGAAGKQFFARVKNVRIDA